MVDSEKLTNFACWSNSGLAFAVDGSRQSCCALAFENDALRQSYFVGQIDSN